MTREKTPDGVKSSAVPGREPTAIEALCSNCEGSLAVGAKTCEACGHGAGADSDSDSSRVCGSCGKQAVDEHDDCRLCGQKQPADRDHKEFETESVAAVTDRGRRHRHNEDAVAIGESDGTRFLLICDGVSSTSGSAEASLRAVRAARDVLVDRVDQNTDKPGVVAALLAATASAQVEASDATPEEGAPAYAQDGPPSSTFVAVAAQKLEEGYRLSVGWLGDSRAYWLDDEPQQITTDHEIGGKLSRWLGADSADATPEIRQLTVSGSGRLVVCSDGLWRYANSPGELQAVIERLITEGSDLEQGVGSQPREEKQTETNQRPELACLPLAAGLVEYANTRGGHDNISVALWSP